MSTAPSDIVVFSKGRWPVLVVEVKPTNMYGTVQTAVALRRSLLAHHLLPDAPFFMLATPIQLFLWPGDAKPDDLPKFTASAQAVLDRYSANPSQGATRSGAAFEIVIFSWLSDLAIGLRKPSPDSAADRLLVEAGLYQQIQGGMADFDVEL